VNTTQRRKRGGVFEVHPDPSPTHGRNGSWLDGVPEVQLEPGAVGDFVDDAGVRPPTAQPLDSIKEESVLLAVGYLLVTDDPTSDVHPAPA
jgi:hypothetical protein